MYGHVRNSFASARGRGTHLLFLRSTKTMRLCTLLLATALLAALGLAEDGPPANCPGGAACALLKSDRKKAAVTYAKGLRLEHDRHSEEAYDDFQAASQLDPSNTKYAITLANARQNLVYEYLQRGSRELMEKQGIKALADFRTVLQFDPTNEFAQQRLQDAAGNWTPDLAAVPLVVQDSGMLTLAPDAAPHEFHFRGDTKEMLSQVAKAYGISVQFDDSVASRHVWFDIDAVSFSDAMRAASAVTKTFWTPLSEKQVLIAADSVDNHRQFDRMGLRRFSFPAVTNPTELNDIVNALRSIFEIRFVLQSPSSGTIEVRAPQRTLEAATQFLESLDDSRPQVILDIQVYELSSSLAHNIGLHVPNNFNLYNIPAAALAALGGQSLQSIINQIASGGLSAANLGSLSTLLSQLQSGQGIFSQPLATFGGGLTFEGLSLDNVTANLSLNESWARDLRHASLRVAQNNEATFKIGERYPILTASFSSGISGLGGIPGLGAAAASATSALSSIGLAPSFTYEDLGLSLKAKPVVYADSSVALTLDMQLRSLGAVTVNNQPIISNREFKGSVTLMDGEPALVTGEVDRSEQLSLSGIPGLGALPLINKSLVDNNKQDTDNELMVIITPHVVSNPRRQAGLEIWLDK